MKSVYIADPAVAAAYHVAPGEWVEVADDAEADWLIANKHAGTLEHPDALPTAGFVHPEAPNPFAPYPGEPAPKALSAPPAPPPSPPPPPRKILRRREEPTGIDE
jgi:hypothetical protein